MRSGAALPTIVRKVLTRALPADWRDDILVDLEETYIRHRACRSRARALAWLILQSSAFTARFVLERLVEAVRSVRLTSSELRVVGRSIRLTPWLTTVSIAALAIAIGVATAAFAVVRGTFYGVLPFPDGDRIVLVQDIDRTGGYPIDVGAAEFWRRRQSLRAFAELAGYYTRNTVLGRKEGLGKPLRAVYATPDLLALTGVAPAIGRLPTQADVAAGSEKMVMLPHTLWQTELGGSLDAIGTRVRVGDEPHSVIAVMPPGFAFPWADEMWIPIQTDPRAADATTEKLRMVGRLVPAVTLEVAQAELSALARLDPTQVPDDHVVAHTVVPFTLGLAAFGQEAMVWSVMAGLLLLLLVMAANIANLVLARNLARGAEIAVRSALGANRARIVTQLLLEVAVMVAIAAVLGLALARALLTEFAARVPDLPFWTDLRLRWPIVVCAIVLAAAVALVAGLVPALRATGGGLGGAAQTGSRSVTDLQFGRLTAAIVVVEVAVSMGFLGAAAVLGHSLLSFGFTGVDLPAEQTLVAQLYFGWPDELRDPEATFVPEERERIRLAFLQSADRRRRDIESALLDLRRVTAVASASRFPGNETDARRIEIDEQPVARLVRSEVVDVGSGVFDLLGVRPTRGRDFRSEELDESLPVTVVNEPFVAAHFGGGNPIGRRIRMLPQSEIADPERYPWVEIVGVVPDLGLNPGNPANGDGVYRPMRPINIMRMAVSVEGDPATLIPDMHRIVRAVDPVIQVQWIKTLEAQMAEPVALFRGLGLGFLALGALALVISTASLHALASFAVTRQVRQIGIRRALGAGRARVASSIFRRNAVQMALGTALGAVLAVALLAAIRTAPFELQPGNPLAFGLAATALTLASLIAITVPLRRALSIQPVEALRTD